MTKRPAKKIKKSTNYIHPQTTISSSDAEAQCAPFLLFNQLWLEISCFVQVEQQIPLLLWHN